MWVAFCADFNKMWKKLLEQDPVDLGLGLDGQDMTLDKMQELVLDVQNNLNELIASLFDDDDMVIPALDMIEL